ncbi:CP4-57 regulatory protein AlpA [Panacagrimonas perspica]|uniref:CP4-57 regulatory protein AlpA n=1 Tax=Panacagrimonas perspica TaxID=381431 RepID=A0A4S3K3D8_9GAMM|nr:CP4-57 regulatory protein AlpA [Panacagrimonas perspica]THD02550.1 hypothetical protein B1810_13400 [Panacagrimonas perspica]
MAKELQEALSILRRKEVQARTGLCRSALYAAVAEGSFAKPIRLGSSRSVGWVNSDVSDWIADMTYVPTWAGFLYLAMVLDAWSRRVVGWSIGEQMTSDLVLAALNMAIEQRRPAEVIHHSDQGSQYTSIAFGERCRKMGVRPSMGTVGDAYDNAMAESFFASLECELIDRRSFKSKAEARTALFTWIEGWYNPRRRHSGLGHQSPINYERRYATPTPTTSNTIAVTA